MSAAGDGVLVRAEGLRVRRADREILTGVDLEVRAGQIVTVIGPNGAGKTTLLRVLLGLLEPDAGSVERRPGLRVGYMPQRLVVDEVLPLTVRRFLGLGGKVPPARLEQVLTEVHVTELIDQPMQVLSGGETQRVLLARALLREPDLLVLDEPAQGVDVMGQGDLYRLIGRMPDLHGCAVLMVSHDLHLVMAAADAVVCLNHHVCCTGHPQAVSQNPEYLKLFGTLDPRGFAVYTHEHHHCHDLHGHVLPVKGSGKGRGTMAEE